MSIDTRFITNEDGQTLADRFKVLIGDDTSAFDCLVGYFYSTGFFLLQDALASTEKIRILIGLGLDRDTQDIVAQARQANQGELPLSHAETKVAYGQTVIEELSAADETADMEAGLRTFIDWIVSGRLELRVYPSHDLHAKVYILTHKSGSRDIGRIVTGSSNLSIPGLTSNLEFNVELKDAPDYHFAKEKFEELWALGVDVSDDFVDTTETKTWASRSITPYELYLKCLYEYFVEDINVVGEGDGFLPDNFMKLEYQAQAVVSASKILKKYGGVFLSDAGQSHEFYP